MQLPLRSHNGDPDELRPSIKRVRVARSGSTRLSKLHEAYVCASDNSPATMGISAEAGDLYVIPTSSKAYEVSYGTAHQPQSATGGDFWLASATHRGGVPSGVSATLKKSGLTTLKVSARSGPDSGRARFSFSYQSTGGGSCSLSTNSLGFQRDLPNSFSVHLPPGHPGSRPRTTPRNCSAPGAGPEQGMGSCGCSATRPPRGTPRLQSGGAGLSRR
ncbi:hypothetical protein OG762_23250 [Streptomyces sp. NBC_01136]|uniref:hypothetical protein n=1 Tax=unclassified Streptomyces TaxID=2593676 RepID=UPI00324B2DD0|nr:hypothetical protein OG762_23250 [Streptomyces sp. NBC_01136]